jgi:patatin-like phospholipase/acyl hydrolase
VVDNADLVAGTSTGGLIALGLAAGQSPAQLNSLYQNKAKEIFSEANRRYLVVRLFEAK